MKKKVGPLPVWAWGMVGVVAIFLYYRYSSSSSSSQSAQVNNGIDPVTGIPYSQEEAAFQNEAASAQMPAAGGGGGVDTTGSGGVTPTTPDLAQELQDVTGLITSLQDAGLVNQGSAPMTNSDGTTAQPTNQSAPVTTPQVSARISTGPLVHKGAIQAPHGAGAPPAKNGYTAVKTGHGNWQYVPDSLVTKAGGYISSAISHTKPAAPKGTQAQGLGHGLWEIVPKPKPKPPKTEHRKPTRAGGFR